MFEKKLRAMFDYQQFSGNRDLERMLHEAEDRCARALSDEDLDLIAAAGKPEIKPEKKKD